MIGGIDSILRTNLTAAHALDTAARVVRNHWTRPVYQNGATGHRYPDYASINFAMVNELLIYRDEDAFRSWEELGADSSNQDTMIHLLCYQPGELTVVVDDDTTSDARVLLEGIRSALADRMRMPKFTVTRDAA